MSFHPSFPFLIDSLWYLPVFGPAAADLRAAVAVILGYMNIPIVNSQRLAASFSFRSRT
jgi:hypothetical protein